MFPEYGFGRRTAHTGAADSSKDGRAVAVVDGSQQPQPITSWLLSFLPSVPSLFSMSALSPWKGGSLGSLKTLCSVLPSSFQPACSLLSDSVFAECIQNFFVQWFPFYVASFLPFYAR